MLEYYGVFTVLTYLIYYLISPWVCNKHLPLQPENSPFGSYQFVVLVNGNFKKKNCAHISFSSPAIRFPRILTDALCFFCVMPIVQQSLFCKHLELCKLWPHWSLWVFKEVRPWLLQEHEKEHLSRTAFLAMLFISCGCLFCWISG